MRLAMERSDTEAQQDVLAELRWDPRTKDEYMHMAVLVRDGIVTLSGQVRCYAHRTAAEQAAQRLQGVRWIVNDLEVEPEDSTDAAIESAIRTLLTGSSELGECAIRVRVDSGWVFLAGSVRWMYQRESAERLAGGCFGVRGITNDIELLPRSPADGEERTESGIVAAFHRNALVDRLNLRVQVAGAEVILRGTAHSWAERLEAARIAWSSPGVRSVDNQITVADDGTI